MQTIRQLKLRVEVISSRSPLYQGDVYNFAFQIEHEDYLLQTNRVGPNGETIVFVTLNMF